MVSGKDVQVSVKKNSTLKQIGKSNIRIGSVLSLSMPVMLNLCLVLHLILLVSLRQFPSLYPHL